MVGRRIAKSLVWTFVAALGLSSSNHVRAAGYVYVPKSYYVAPPLMSNYYPIFRPAPIVAYELVPVAAPPVAGYYYPLPATAGRVRESGWELPNHSRYRYQYQAPNGAEYRYRYKRDGGQVRFTESWER